MKRFALVTALALALTACGASTPPPAPVPPKPAIVALAHPPAAIAPAPAAEVTLRTLDHKFWSMQVPSNWQVENDSEEGVKVTRVKAPGVLPASVEVISQDLTGADPQEFVMVMSVIAEKQVPEGVTVTGVQRKAGKYKGHTSSITQVNTDKGVFLGVLATCDEANHTGYAVVAIAPMTPEDGRLMGAISQTFTVKTDAPPEAEEATPAPPPPAKPAPKATPKKK